MKTIPFLFTLLLICLTAMTSTEAFASNCKDDLCRDLKLAMRSSPRLSIKRGAISNFFRNVGIELEENPLEKIEASVQGMNLKGSRFMIQAVADVYGERPAKQAVNRARNCTTPECALMAAYGSREALMKAMIIYFRYGLVFSIDQNYLAYLVSKKFARPGTNEALWTPALMDLYSSRLSQMPTALRGNDKVIRLYITHVHMGALFTVTEVDKNLNYIIGETAILLYAGAKKSVYGQFDFSKALIHELGHHYETDLNPSIKQDFQRLSGWTQDLIAARESSEALINGKKSDQRQGWSHSPDACFISDYASTNFAEDFAETTAFYSVFPEKLRDTCPAKFQFAEKLYRNGVL